MTRIWLVWVVVFGVACSAASVVSVLDSSANAVNAAPCIKISVDATSTHLPLNIAGSSVAFGDVDHALERSLAQALTPLEHELEVRGARQHELFVELTAAHAEYVHGRLVSELTVRATLRQTSGNAYLAQTHAHATASAMTPPERGAPTVIQCTDAIAAQLSGWLSGMTLN